MVRLRKIFAASVIFVTVLSMSVVVAPNAQAAAAPGDLIKMDGIQDVYYLGADGKRYVFPNEKTYFSWYSDFSGVMVIPQTELMSYDLASNVTIRPGTKLVKITTDPRVYAVAANGELKWLPDEATAKGLYGDDWAKRVVDVPDSFIGSYKVNGKDYGKKTTADVEATKLTATAYPAGTLIKTAESADVYYINAEGKAQKVANEAALVANRFKLSDVVTTTLAIPTAGDNITAQVATLVDTSSGAGGTAGAGTGLTVALASDTPATTQIISDGAGTSLDGQASVPVIKLNFTAAADGDVKVTTLKLSRTGISADADIDNAYLYDGDSILSRLADMQSISSKIMTFTASTGLFTVTKGTTKSILVRFDLNRESTSGKTIGFNVAAASDITTDGAAVSGSFPLSGNLMSTATVTDFGGVNISRVNDNSTAVNPGTTGFTAAHYTVAPSNQNLQVEYLKLQMIGSATAADVTNVKLYDGSTQIGTTQQLDSTKTAVFDLTASPLAITSNQTKNLYVKVDVTNGSTRTFYFSLQRKADFIVKDTAYGIYITPNNGTIGTFTSQDSGTVTIGSGSLAVSKMTGTDGSPTGNIADASTNVTLAKYSLKATGEDIKVSAISYYSTVTTNHTLKNSKVLLDGTQIGTTNATLSAGTTNSVTTTVNFTVAAGQTRTLSIVADTTGTTAANDTVQITLNVGASNGQRSSALTTLNVPDSSMSANTLTVKTGAITSAKNTGLGDASAANPTGVVGKLGAKIGSFTITAGAGENATISKITLSDQNVAGFGLSTMFQNLMIKRQDTGAQVGSTISTLQSSLDYSYEFSPTATLTITNGQTLAFDVYADILTNATNTGTAFTAVRVKSVTATGASTQSDASDNTARTLQNAYLSSSGNLTIENVPSSDQVPSQIVYASSATSNTVDLYKFKLTAVIEAIDVSRFIISDTIQSGEVSATTANGTPTTTLTNFELWDGTTKIAGPVSLTATATPVSGGYIDFNLGSDKLYTVQPGSPKVITLKAIVNNEGGISSGSTHQFTLNATPVQDSDTTRAITARGHDSSATKNGPSTGISGSVITAREAYPVISRLAAATNLPAGSGTDLLLAKFKVKAQGGEIRLKKMTFDVTINDTTTSTALSFSSFKLYRNGSLVASTEYDIFDGTGTAAADQLSNSGTATLTTSALQGASLGAPSSTSTRMVLIFSPVANLAGGQTGSGEEIVGAGSENTYEIKANYSSAHQGATNDSDSIVVQLLGEDSLTAPTTGDLSRLTETAYRFGVVGLASTNRNFIWSDNSATLGDHTNTIPSTGDDWANGYQVRGADVATQVFLPLDSWTVGK